MMFIPIFHIFINGWIVGTYGINVDNLSGNLGGKYMGMHVCNWFVLRKYMGLSPLMLMI